MTPPPADGYRWIEHTAELELEIRGADAPAVFAQALAAFAELSGDDGAPAGDMDTVTRRIALAGQDEAMLLAAWLDELEFLAETESLVPAALDRFHLGRTGVDATVRCRRGNPRTVIKGTTLHRLSFARGPGGYVATVVLDV